MLSLDLTSDDKGGDGIGGSGRGEGHPSMLHLI